MPLQAQQNAEQTLEEGTQHPVRCSVNKLQFPKIQGDTVICNEWDWNAESSAWASLEKPGARLWRDTRLSGLASSDISKYSQVPVSHHYEMK
jgi:hypothetical protein